MVCWCLGAGSAALEEGTWLVVLSLRNPTVSKSGSKWTADPARSVEEVVDGDLDNVHDNARVHGKPTRQDTHQEPQDWGFAIAAGLERITHAWSWVRSEWTEPESWTEAERVEVDGRPRSLCRGSRQRRS